ncbi:MAG: hypothetical protein ABI609_15870 [Acidobacteriota bacterium]
MFSKKERDVERRLEGDCGVGRTGSERLSGADSGRRWVRALTRGGMIAVLLGAGLGLTCFGAPGGPHLMGVPFEPESIFTDDYCLASSIQMWRDYDHVSPHQTQDQIYQWLGGNMLFFSPDLAASGVRHFTDTGIHAIVDAALRSDLTDRHMFLSRQITTVMGQIPALVIYNNHAVIIDGGQWHQDPATGLNVWDTVAIQDPAAFLSDTQFSGGTWVQLTCSDTNGSYKCVDVIPAEYVAQGNANYDSYGGSIRVRGAPPSI